MEDPVTGTDINSFEQGDSAKEPSIDIKTLHAKIEQKTAEPVSATIILLLDPHTDKVLTLISDNRKEFARHGEIGMDEIWEEMVSFNVIKAHKKMRFKKFGWLDRLVTRLTSSASSTNRSG